MLPPPETILVVFLLFCRIGGCLVLMPGFPARACRAGPAVRCLRRHPGAPPLLLPAINTVVPVQRRRRSCS
jgi:hypothetical protein